MTSVQRLETRLTAWRSFRGVARASRTLAAAQSLYWAEQLGRVERWLVRVDELAVAYPRLPQNSAQSVVLVIGTDLGLCGPLNTQVAAAVQPMLATAALTFVVGQRLEGLVDARAAVHLASPTSFAAVQTLAATIDSLLGPNAEQTDLTVVVATGVLPDGAPIVETRTDREPRSGRVPPSRVELSPQPALSTMVQRLQRHARITHALTRGATSESEARYRTMNRAHDAADRRIGEQELNLRKLRQEMVTQEILEVRRGANTASDLWTVRTP